MQLALSNANNCTYPGIYRGVVVSTREFSKPPHRIRVAVPKLTDDAGMLATPCFPAPGFLPTPKEGDGVWVMFEGGDINYPVYVGFFGELVSSTLSNGSDGRGIHVYTQATQPVGVPIENGDFWIIP